MTYPIAHRTRVGIEGFPVVRTTRETPSGPACSATSHGSEAQWVPGGLPDRRVATMIHAAAASPFALRASTGFDVAQRAFGGASARMTSR